MEMLKSIKSKLNTKLQGTIRPVYVIVSMIVVIAGLLPVFAQSASAALITSRSIEMSNSTPAATGVTYTLTFTPITAETTTGAIIVDFCSDTPIIGATCAFTPTSVPTVSSATSSAGTISYPGSNGHTIEVTGLTWTTSPFTITFTNVTNPSTTASFYARVLTYSTTANANGYVPATTTGGATTTGTYVDSGGVALSTAQVINITAKVMEQLTFCVSGTTISTCASTTTPNVALGHGTPVVLDSLGVYTADAYTQTSTNAGTGVTVRMKDTSSTTCGGLSSNGGTSCGIPASNTTGPDTAQTMTAGTAAFGMCVLAASANTTAVAPYNGASCNTSGTTYGMDDYSATDVRTTYGSSIITSSGPLNAENDTLDFAATASLTTPAGAYAATEDLICTGVF
jgi:hypothetical protein